MKSCRSSFGATTPENQSPENDLNDEDHLLMAQMQSLDPPNEGPGPYPNPLLEVAAPFASVGGSIASDRFVLVAGVAVAYQAWLRTGG